MQRLWLVICDSYSCFVFFSKESHIILKSLTRPAPGETDPRKLYLTKHVSFFSPTFFHIFQCQLVYFCIHKTKEAFKQYCSLRRAPCFTVCEKIWHPTASHEVVVVTKSWLHDCTIAPAFLQNHPTSANTMCCHLGCHLECHKSKLSKAHRESNI